MTPWFRQTLHRQVVAVGLMGCVVAIAAVWVLMDRTYSQKIFEQVAVEARLLLDQILKARIAHEIRRSEIQRSELGLRAAFVQPLESLLLLDQGRAAYITLGDEVLWQSDERLGKPPGSQPPGQGRWGGLGTITYADRTHEAYLVRTTVVQDWPVPAHTAGSSGADRPPETYAVTYHVALVTERYRSEIMKFRGLVAGVVAVALLAIGAAMYVVMRRLLRPLARFMQRVSDLEAWSGQRIRGRDGDPQEIRTLTERFNEFLQSLDDAGGWERTCHGRLRTVLQVAEKELSPDSRINQKGFMHSLSHLLSAIPLTEFKTIPEAEKEAVHKDFMRVRSMIERKLHDLVSSDAGESARLADVAAVATDFFARRGHGEENFMQSFMRRRHPDRSFEHHKFELLHEGAPLLARIDKSDLYELMFNLLHNAGKAAAAQVRMTIARRGETVRIVVENDGKRFPPAVRENLMVDTESTDGEGEGHGIGLPYVRRVARDHGGDLALEDSDDLGGARAVLELPLVDGTAGDAAVDRARDEAALRALPPSNART